VRDFEIILVILTCGTFVVPLARRFDVPPAIAQVVSGLVLSALPFAPRAAFDPDLVFALLVPPLLYRAAATSSLRDTRRLAYPIAGLAVPLVLLTAFSVGFVVHLVMPSLPWTAAVVLGAIVAPPDADVTTSIARRLGLPARLVTVLEGETLLNDATAFMTYRMAVAAAAAGTFSVLQATRTFLVLAVVGVAVGLAVGLLVSRVRRLVGDPVTEGTVSLLTPFAAYLAAERLAGSGVLAVVITGFCVSRFLPRTVSVAARVRAYIVWEGTAFLVSAFIFVLIGLQLGQVAPAFLHDDARELLWMTVLVFLTMVGTRFLWVFLTAWPGVFAPEERGAPPGPRPWRGLAVLSWSGLRGGDSLVMVLAIPLVTLSGAPFPGREIIVAVSFGVILTTLVLEGLTLRPLIRLLGFPRDDLVDAEERQGRQAAERAALARLADVAERDGLSPTVRAYVEGVVRRRTALDIDEIDHVSGHDGRTEADVIRHVGQEVRDAARQAVLQLRDDDVIGDAAMNRVVADLDLEDLRSAESGAM
jgi:Na+/H+ antiporter